MGKGEGRSFNSEVELEVLHQGKCVYCKYSSKCEADNYWKTIRINPASIILRRKGKTTNLCTERKRRDINHVLQYVQHGEIK